MDNLFEKTEIGSNDTKPSLDFGKMRVGLKVVENPVIDIDYALKRANPALA